MKKIKNFKDFLKESTELDYNDVNHEYDEDELLVQGDGLMMPEPELSDVEQEVQTEEEMQVQDDYIGNEYDYDEEIVDENIEEEEELDEKIQLVYNTETEEWEQNGEMELPENYDTFLDWFMNIDEEEDDYVSMKEEDNEIVFHLPIDKYLEFLER